MTTTQQGSSGEGAARVGDRTSHEAMLISGETTVLIEGAFAAREGDLLVCPKHGLGRIAVRSSDVLCGGRWLARRTDDCACGAAKLEVVKTVDAEGRSTAQQVEARGYGGPSATATIEDKDGDGTSDSMQIEGVAASIKTPTGSTIEVGKISASDRMNVTDTGAQVQVSREVAAIKETNAFKIGPVEFEATGRVAAVGANADVLVGNSGTERGLRLRGGMGASAVDGALRGKAPVSMLALIPSVLPFATVLQSMRADPKVDALMKPFDMKLDVTAGVGAGVGFEEGVWAVQDLTTCEVRVGGMLEVGPVSLEVNMARDGAPSCAAPHDIATCAETVRIGARK